MIALFVGTVLGSRTRCALIEGGIVSQQAPWRCRTRARSPGAVAWHTPGMSARSRPWRFFFAAAARQRMRHGGWPDLISLDVREVRRLMSLGLSTCCLGDHPGACSQSGPPRMLAKSCLRKFIGKEVSGCFCAAPLRFRTTRTASFLVQAGCNVPHTKAALI